MALESTVLEGIKFYDPDGKPIREYKPITIAGEAVKEQGAYVSKTQDNWISRHRERREEFPSVPLYMAIMEKTYDLDHNHPLLRSIAKDIKDSWICTSTRINYAENKIIHGYGGRSPLELSCTFPEGRHHVKDIKDDKQWRRALQSLFLTPDIDKTLEMLERTSGVPPYIWTTDGIGRRSNPLSAAFLNVNTVRLDLDYYYHDISGRSRSVAFGKRPQDARRETEPLSQTEDLLQKLRPYLKRGTEQKAKRTIHRILR